MPVEVVKNNPTVSICYTEWMYDACFNVQYAYITSYIFYIHVSCKQNEKQF